MSEIVNKITSRGYRRVTIRPAQFNSKRVADISSLFPILQKTSVGLRGWNFPHLDERNSPRIDIDWISQETEWQHHISLWRFYQSGQFFHIAGIPGDWRDHSSLWPADDSSKVGTLLGVGDTVFSFTEIFEFAARLSLTDAGDEQMEIDITYGNLSGRTLYVDSQRRWPFDFAYKTSLSEFPSVVSIDRVDLVARARDLALERAADLFKRFGWNVKPDVLRSWQEELTK